jgi:imidazole glycerol phosphate synthase glutamine amidotransferase subunit
MDQITVRGLGAVLSDRIGADLPTLAICVGFQLLARSSTESPEAAGLGVIDGALDRFPQSIATPQLGWNQVTADEGSRLIGSGWAYFANSYRLTEAPDGWVPARCTHGEQFVAAIERGNVLGCQFHPELSGSFGTTVLTAWLDSAKEAA